MNLRGVYTYYYNVICKTKIIYSVKRDSPDYGITEEELSSSKYEKESDFENFVCPLSSGEKYTSDEKSFLV